MEEYTSIPAEDSKDVKRHLVHHMLQDYKEEEKKRKSTCVHGSHEVTYGQVITDIH